MRIVSLGLCTVFALSCGDGDQVVVDPSFLEPGARPGSNSDANARRGAEHEGTDPGGGASSLDGDGAMTPGQASACADAPASAKTCSAGTPRDDAASTDGELPTGNAGSGGNESDGSAGASAGSGGSGGSGSGSGASATNGGSGSGNPSGSGGTGDTGNGGSDNQAEALPDLILDSAYLMGTIQQDTVDASADQCLFNEGCVTGDGLRRVVRFGTRSANVGSADVVVGEPVAGNPLWEFDACHQHFHFEGYARYDLVDASSGVVLPIGNKNGFCLRDLDSWNNPSCATYDCNYQGISVGCADVYTPDLDCQWVDITDVAPGTYQLVVTVNTERSIAEQSFDNNSAAVTIEISPTTIRVIP